jgi:hypothetical protein
MLFLLIRVACRSRFAVSTSSPQFMRFSWSLHQNVAKRLQTVPQQQLGVALALMGVAILMLSEDLVACERQVRFGSNTHLASPSSLQRDRP